MMIKKVERLYCTHKKFKASITLQIKIEKSEQSH